MSLARKLGVIATVYVIEGFPMGVHNLWDVYLRRSGVSRTEIGVLMGALGFAWSLKVFWSPLVGRFGEHRRWIAGAMLTMAACLLGGIGVILKGPSALGFLLLLILIIAVFITAKVEEEDNVKRFGEEYVAYRKTTKMFIPHLI